MVGGGRFSIACSSSNTLNLHLHHPWLPHTSLAFITSSLHLVIPSTTTTITTTSIHGFPTHHQHSSRIPQHNLTLSVGHKATNKQTITQTDSYINAG
ncbi:hypothetical protein E2C01_028329 [Portunus trituberculatus]|uniref:Uncharacterized protein n=1 Tax=Portunus trituberculatus TaxID=210409 RepID=A0A5B7ENC4_PORTR|nr:hypothetical protein [Portunus trituberculatus]